MLSENSFQRLDPDFLLKSMETIGFEPTGRCIPLNSVENRVYDIEVEGNVRYVVKYYRPHRWTKDQIQEEHNFLDELQAQEIPVLTPIKDESNQSIFEYDNILFAVWPLRTGRIIEEIADWLKLTPWNWDISPVLSGEDIKIQTLATNVKHDLP